MYLHSTIYLFQPRALSKSSRFFINIYIPLCIYFNHITICSYIFTFLFTFHYVSISTLGNPTPSAVSIKFTFHYVSISTQRIRIAKTRVRTFTFHYVSISTTLTTNGTVLLSAFTFHYVSISTNTMICTI